MDIQRENASLREPNEKHEEIARLEVQLHNALGDNELLRNENRSLHQKIEQLEVAALSLDECYNKTVEDERRNAADKESALDRLRQELADLRCEHKQEISGLKLELFESKAEMKGKFGCLVRNRCLEYLDLSDRFERVNEVVKPDLATLLLARTPITETYPIKNRIENIIENYMRLGVDGVTSCPMSTILDTLSTAGCASTESTQLNPTGTGGYIISTPAVPGAADGGVSMSGHVRNLTDVEMEDLSSQHQSSVESLAVLSAKNDDLHQVEKPHPSEGTHKTSRESDSKRHAIIPGLNSGLEESTTKVPDTNTPLYVLRSHPVTPNCVPDIVNDVSTTDHTSSLSIISENAVDGRELTPRGLPLVVANSEDTWPRVDTGCGDIPTKRTPPPVGKPVDHGDASTRAMDDCSRLAEPSTSHPNGETQLVFPSDGMLEPTSGPPTSGRKNTLQPTTEDIEVSFPQHNGLNGGNGKTIYPSSTLARNENVETGSTGSAALVESPSNPNKTRKTSKHLPSLLSPDDVLAGLTSMQFVQGDIAVNLTSPHMDSMGIMQEGPLPSPMSADASGDEAPKVSPGLQGAAFSQGDWIDPTTSSVASLPLANDVLHATHDTSPPTPKGGNSESGSDDSAIGSTPNVYRSGHDLPSPIPTSCKIYKRESYRVPIAEELRRLPPSVCATGGGQQVNNGSVDGSSERDGSRQRASEPPLDRSSGSKEGSPGAVPTGVKRTRNTRLKVRPIIHDSDDSSDDSAVSTRQSTSDAQPLVALNEPGDTPTMGKNKTRGSPDTSVGPGVLESIKKLHPSVSAGQVQYVIDSMYNPKLFRKGLSIFLFNNYPSWEKHGIWHQDQYDPPGSNSDAVNRINDLIDMDHKNQNGIAVNQVRELIILHKIFLEFDHLVKSVDKSSLHQGRGVSSVAIDMIEQGQKHDRKVVEKILRRSRRLKRVTSKLGLAIILVAGPYLATLVRGSKMSGEVLDCLILYIEKGLPHIPKITDILDGIARNLVDKTPLPKLEEFKLLLMGSAHLFSDLLNDHAFVSQRYPLGQTEMALMGMPAPGEYICESIKSLAYDQSDEEYTSVSDVPPAVMPYPTPLRTPGNAARKNRRRGGATQRTVTESPVAGASYWSSNCPYRVDEVDTTIPGPPTPCPPDRTCKKRKHIESHGQTKRQRLGSYCNSRLDDLLEKAVEVPPDLEVAGNAVLSGTHLQKRKRESASPREQELPTPKRLRLEGPGNKRWTQSLVYPLRGEKPATVQFEDLGRLDEGAWLNDNLIWFYLRYLQDHLEKSRPDDAKSIYLFDTYFYERLTKNAKEGRGINYEAVHRWVKVDLFKFNYVIVPINEDNAHWYVAIICNLPAVGEKADLGNTDADTTSCRPTIVTLDSKGLPHNDTTQRLKEYLILEAKEKHSLCFETPDITAVTAKGIPQQGTDNSDCGVYLLLYVKEIFQNPWDLVNRLVRGNLGEEKHWPHASKMRKHIRDIILGLAGSQGISAVGQEMEPELVSDGTTPKVRATSTIRFRTPATSTSPPSMPNSPLAERGKIRGASSVIVVSASEGVEAPTASNEPLSPSVSCNWTNHFRMQPTTVQHTGGEDEKYNPLESKGQGASRNSVPGQADVIWGEDEFPCMHSSQHTTDLIGLQREVHLPKLTVKPPGEDVFEEGWDDQGWFKPAGGMIEEGWDHQAGDILDIESWFRAGENVTVGTWGHLTGGEDWWGSPRRDNLLED